MWLLRCVVVCGSGAMLLAQGADGRQPPPAPPVAATVVRDLRYHEGFAKSPRSNELDLYLPRGVRRPPLVMFVHGGAWTGGKRDFGAPLAQALTQYGIACASIDTQQFPFATPAAMVTDCAHALAWLHEHADEHGYDGDQLFVMGHSSGGHLVSWLALDDERLAAAGVPHACLRGAIALSGVHELRARHPVLEKVFGKDPAVRADASPITHASAGDPPMLLLWGEHDMAGLALCGRMLRDRLRELGVPVLADELAGKNHVDYVFALPQPGDAVLARIAAFVKAPPATAAPRVAPAALAVPTTVRLAAGAIEVLQPAGRAAAACVLWVGGDDGDRELANAVARALVPWGAAVVRLDGVDRAAAVAAAWRELRAQAKALGLPAPSVLGGIGRGGVLAIDAALTRRDGLVGRIVAGSDLGPAAARLAQFAGPREERCALLFVQGGGDAKAQRDDVVALGSQLLIQQFDVHVIETGTGTTRDVVRGLGTAGDVLLPALRAFVLP